MRSKSAKSIVKENVLLCKREKEKNFIVIWVVDHPGIRAQATSLTEAEEQLVDKVWNMCQLDEPFSIKYDNVDLAASVPGNPLFWVGANNLIDTTDPAQYFQNGFCATCRKGIGGRNKKPLMLEGVPKGMKSGFMVRFQTAGGLGKGADIIHVDICKMIRKVCQPLVEFREVMDIKYGPTNYCEVIPARNFFEVSPIGRKEPGGKCVTCGSIRLYGEVKKKYIGKADADIIRQHGAAAIGTYGSKFCVSSRVWESITKLEASRRLLKECVFIELEDKEINHRPKFEKILP